MQITEIFIELPVFRTRIISGYFPICIFRLPDGSYMFYGKNKRILIPYFILEIYFTTLVGHWVPILTGLEYSKMNLFLPNIKNWIFC